jgi:glycosyltransferase involved in cell wall biosynthesis
LNQLKDIICFANDWFADPLSKKHVMVRMAKDRKVLWINSINNRAPTLKKHDLNRIREKLAHFQQGLMHVEGNIWVLSPIFIPFHGNRLFQAANRWLLGFQIRNAARKLNLESPVSWVYAPTAAGVVGNLGEHAIVYHCVDEFSAFSDAGSAIVRRENDLLQKSHLVVTSSARLQESKSRQNSNCHFVPHGVDYEHFRKTVAGDTPVAPEFKDLPRPVLGFHGLIADWVNLELIAALAKRRPEWSIVIIGKVQTDVSMLDKLPNVHLVGHRPYAQLPEYLKGFDVAILPFMVNELTLAANPLKLREYVAAGLPVIAAPLPEVVRLGKLVNLASTAEEYEACVLRLLQAGKTGPDPALSAEMRSESWDTKVEELKALLGNIGARSSGAAR